MQQPLVVAAVIRITFSIDAGLACIGIPSPIHYNVCYSYRAYDL